MTTNALTICRDYRNVLTHSITWAEDWIICVLLPICTCSVWRNMVSSICQITGRHFNHSVDTLIWKQHNSHDSHIFCVCADVVGRFWVVCALRKPFLDHITICWCMVLYPTLETVTWNGIQSVVYFDRGRLCGWKPMIKSKCLIEWAAYVVVKQIFINNGGNRKN